MKRLCQYLKQRNIPVEINLLGLSQHRHYPSARFLSIAQEVGNNAIIGCDAHIPEQLSDQKLIQDGIELAEKFHLPLVEFLPGLEPQKR